MLAQSVHKDLPWTLVLGGSNDFIPWGVRSTESGASTQLFRPKTQRHLESPFAPYIQPTSRCSCFMHQGSTSWGNRLSA